MSFQSRFAIAAVLFLLQAGFSSALAAYSNGTVVVNESAYTFQTLYLELNNGSVFSYNNISRTGVLGANLDIKGGGELYVSNETLRVNSSAAANYSIVVNGGTLHLNESSNLTVADPAYRYYVVVNSGGLDMRNSYLSYAGYGTDGNGNRSGLWIGTSNSPYAIRGNVFSNNYVGLFLRGASNVNFSSNTILGSNYSGAYLESASSATNLISGNNISGSPIGVYLNNSNSNVFSYNAISAYNYSLYLNFSNSNTVSWSNLSAPIGVYLANSSSNSFRSNNISAVNYGAYLESSGSNAFSYGAFSAQSGVYSNNSFSNFFLSATLSSLYLNHSGARLEDSNISGNASLFSSSADFLASSYSSLALDPSSNITRLWHPPIYIYNGTSPLSGANFTATGLFGSPFSALSDSNGRIFWNATQYFQNSTDILNYTPHNVTAFKGALRYLASYSFNNNSGLFLYLIPPNISWANFSVQITGRNVTILANVSDPLNISSVVAGVRNASGAETNYSMLLVSGSPSNGSYGYNFSANGSIGTHSVWIYANNSQDSRALFFAGSFDVRRLSFSFFNISDSFLQQDGILNPNESFRALARIQEFNGSSYFNVSGGAFNLTINGTQYELQFNGSFWRSVSYLTASGSAGYQSFSANVSGVSSNSISGFSSANYPYSVRTSSVSANASSSVANQNSSVTVSGAVSYFNGSSWFNSSYANVSFWLDGSFAGSALADGNGSYSHALTIPSSAGTRQILVNATDSFGIAASNSTSVQARLSVGNITLLGIPSGTTFVTRGTLVNISAFVRKSPIGNITSVIAVVSGSVNKTFPLSNATRINESGWWSGPLNLSSVSHSLGNSTVAVYANESTNLTQQVPAPFSSFRIQNISLSLSLSSSASSPNSLLRFYGRAILNPDNSNVSNRLLYFYSTDPHSNTTPIIINESYLLSWDGNASWLSGSFRNSTLFNSSIAINNTQAFFRDNLSLLSSSANVTLRFGTRLSRAGDAVSSFSLSNRTGPLSWGNSSLWHAGNLTKKISRFSPNGTQLSNFSFNSSINPAGIAYVGGHVFISDALALQLYNFSTNGSLNSNYSLPNGTGFSLAFDGANLWTSDSGKWLFKLNPDGSLASNLSTNASNVSGIAWDGAYLAYIDSAASIVHRIYRTDGSEVSNFSVQGGIGSLAWDGSHFWSADNSSAYQLRVDSPLSGNVTSLPIASSYPVIWNSFSASDSVPNGTNVSYLLLDSSTGTVLCNLSNNTNVTDCANSSSVMLFANLTTNDPANSPVIYNWSLSWTANYSSASYLSNTTPTEYPIIFVSYAANKTNFQGSNVSIEFSVDNGTTWLAANGSYTWAADISNRYFSYRAAFNTSNPGVSASLDRIFFEYRTAPHTDINGSFNYSFTAPQSYGYYTITANLTDQNGIYGVNVAALSMPAPPVPFVVGPSTPLIVSGEETLSTLRLYPKTPTPIPVTIESAAITEFVVSVQKLASNVLISVKRLEELPAEVPSPGGSVYRLLEFSKANLDDDNIETLAARFKVNDSWLSANDLNRSSVAMLRYSGGRWSPLRTSLYKRDDHFSYFESELPGFSLFAIKAEKNIPPPPSPPPPPPPPPEIPPPPPILRQRDIDIALERFYSLNETAVSEEARNILYQAMDKLQLSQKAFSSGNLTVAKDLLSQAGLLMDASTKIKAAVPTPVWYYVAPALVLLLLIGFAYRNMSTQIQEKPDISQVLEQIRATKQALAQLESDYLENKIDPDTYRMKRAQIKARIDELKAALNTIQQAGK